jgi:hypothetical protein
VRTTHVDAGTLRRWLSSERSERVETEEDDL